MRLSTLITLGAALPLMLAFPFTNMANTTSNATCSTQPFQIIGFETFTAAPGPRQPDIPEPFGASHLSFLFIDPNFGRPGSCIRSLAAGAGGSVASAGKYYPCIGNPSLEYVFDGKVLGLKHSFDCQQKDITTSGSKDIQGSVNCFEAFNGVSCNSNVDTIEIPITDVTA
ncbi:hypothetical protein G7Y79_00001g002840 [Physcia stellaris]|nr:hypothetical protein G7Y79_00001g002840 [Physcia stellaris]